jgi:hypothetical protein
MNDRETSRDINKVEIDDPWCYATNQDLILRMPHGKEFLAKRKAHEDQLIAEAKVRAEELSHPSQPSTH